MNREAVAYHQPQIVSSHTVYELAPGRYVIGDPCYNVPKHHWGSLLESCDYFEQSALGYYDTDPTLEKDHRRVYVIALSTRYGDGLYVDNQGHRYGVDAGLIGIIHADDLDEIDTDLSRVVEFDKPFRVYESEPGVLHFGHITIDTSGDSLDEESIEEETDEDETDEDDSDVDYRAGFDDLTER